MRALVDTGSLLARQNTIVRYAIGCTCIYYVSLGPDNSYMAREPSVSRTSRATLHQSVVCVRKSCDRSLVWNDTDRNKRIPRITQQLNFENRKTQATDHHRISQLTKYDSFHSYSPQDQRFPIRPNVLPDVSRFSLASHGWICSKKSDAQLSIQPESLYIVAPHQH